MIKGQKTSNYWKIILIYVSKESVSPAIWWVVFIIKDTSYM